MALLTVSASCAQPRRPTAQEVESWNRAANAMVAWSIVWEVVAIAAVTFAVWDLLSRREDRYARWSIAVPILVLILGIAMLSATFTFVALWTA